MRQMMHTWTGFFTRGRVAALAFALALQFSWATSMVAQNGKGTIHGHVTDSSGGVLQGAEIALSPVSLTAATDVQGEFFIRNLDAGAYTLTISYIGFQSV